MSASKITFRLPGGDEKQFDVGVTGFEIAESIGSRLAKDALAVRLNGKVIDLRVPLNEGGDFSVITIKDEEGGNVIRHSAEHVLADAVKRLWPSVQIDVGRTDHSEKFQYDFKIDHAFTEADLEKIETKAKEILKEKSVFQRKVVSRNEAKEFFRRPR